MPSRFVRHLAGLSLLLCVCVSVHAANCEKLLIPDLMFPHHDQATELAYLSTITAANFDAHKKNALLDQDPGTHPERYHADDPVGLALPLAKELLTSSADFEEFSRKRDAAFRDHHFAYPKEDLSVFFARSLQPHRADAYNKCVNTNGFTANIVRSERNLVEVTIGWRPSSEATEATVSNVSTAGATMRGTAPTKLTAKEPKTLLFIRHLNKDFRFTATVAGAPVSVFVPKYLVAKTDAPASTAQCTSAAKVVQALYQQILLRSPTPAELSQQSTLLTGGIHSVRQLVEILVTGPDYAKKFIDGKSTDIAVTTLYLRILGRQPDTNGMNYNKRVFDSSGYQKVAVASIEGREYQLRFGDWTVPDANPTLRFCPGK